MTMTNASEYSSELLPGTFGSRSVGVGDDGGSKKQEEAEQKIGNVEVGVSNGEDENVLIGKTQGKKQQSASDTLGLPRAPGSLDVKGLQESVGDRFVKDLSDYKSMDPGKPTVPAAAVSDLLGNANHIVSSDQEEDAENQRRSVAMRMGMGTQAKVRVRVRVNVKTSMTLIMGTMPSSRRWMSPYSLQGYLPVLF